MSTSLLGQPFDIHGGGMDLKFPHHENEIAQSEAAGGVPFVKWWMHAGLLQVEGEKMSKSLGNFITIRQALAEHHPEELRFFMMNSLYRRPADYTDASLHEAKQRLRALYRCLLDLPAASDDSEDSSDYQRRFIQAMEDDFNTPLALTILDELSGQINSLRTAKKTAEAAILGKTLTHLGNILGILQQSPANYFKGARSAVEWQQIDALRQARDQARAQKNWPEADRIRQQLLAMGLEVEDTSTGTRISQK